MTAQGGSRSRRRVHAAGLVVALAFVPTLAALAVAEPVTATLAAAVQHRDRAHVQALLKTGANVHQALPDGSTALHWAVRWDDEALVEQLLRAGATVDVANRFGATPLWMACAAGSQGVAEALLKAGADARARALGGEPLLMTAVKSGNLAIVRALLDRGADVNAAEPRLGQTALMWAAGGRKTDAAIARELIARGAQLDRRSAGGLTPLLFAVREGDVDVVDALIKAGANVKDRAMLADGGKIGIFGDGQWTTPSVDGSSALNLAIMNGHFEVATHLLDAGADPNVSAEAYPFRNRPNISLNGEALKPGFAALHALVARHTTDPNPAALDLMKAIVAKGGEINGRTAAVKAPTPTQLNPQPIITWVQVGGVSAFWVAANALDVEAMKALVDLGADPRLPSMEQATPLMVAAGLGTRSRGPSGGLPRRGNVNLEALDLLLTWGNDINAQNANGQTALHAAAFAAAHQAVQFLVDHGARMDLRDSMGRTPLDVANDNLRVEFRPSLQNHEPEDVDKTILLLTKLSGEPAAR
ncbi:MAG: ankyrin repeat domain-containing protein [Vicinamibacterales bacterium]